MSAAIWLLVVVLCLVLSTNSRAQELVRIRHVGPVYWPALAAALVTAVAPLITPGADDQPDAGAFSVDRAQVHIDVVAARPHPMGSSANAAVRSYIAEQLEAFDLIPELQSVPGVIDYYSNSGATVPVVNVIARIPGTASTGSIALVAHYDTFPATPGANDNTSGVAVILETARVLTADEPLRNDVILVFTDGEEPAPRFGSTAFVDDHRFAGGVEFIVNLEAIGSSGPSMLMETNGPQSWVLDRYVDSVPQPVAFSFLTETMETIGGSNTDFAPFRDAGIAGVEFVYATGSPIYHTSADSADTVGSRSLHSHGANTMALVRDLGRQDLSEIDGDDQVFFTIGRFHVVRYPTSWAVPLLMLTGIALFGAIRHTRQSWGTIVRHAVSTLLRSLVLSVGAVAIWMALAGWRSAMGIVESYLYLFVFAAIVLSIVARFPSRQPEGPATAAGVLGLLWLLGVPTSVLAPGMSYLFVVPSFLGAIALAAWSNHDQGWERLGAAILTVGVTLVLLVPAVDAFFQFAQPRPGNPGSEILPTVAIPVFLLALVIELAVSFHRGGNHLASTPREAPARARRQPMDPANGLRVGTLLGALLGAGVVAVSGVLSSWIVAGLGAVGGGIGYWSERRRLPIRELGGPHQSTFSTSLPRRRRR